MGTEVAVSTGYVETTVGAVTSALVPVVNVQVKFAASAPPADVIAPLVMLAVITVELLKFPVGLKTAVVPM